MLQHASFRRFLVATACVTMVAVPTPATAAPPPVEPGGNTMSWTLPEERRTLDGIDPVAHLAVSIPPGWQQAGPGTLEMSPTIGSNAVALVSVLVDGRYVDDVLVEGAAGARTVELPADAFRVGENDVAIEADIDLVVDDECEDRGHPARRMTLDGVTRLTVPLAPVGSYSVGDFPEALEPLGSDERIVDVHFVGILSGPLVSAAVEIVAAVRRTADLPIDVAVHVHEPTRFSIDAVTDARPSLIVGRAADLAGQPSNRDSSVHVTRRTDGHAVLVVSGATDDDVLAAARELAADDVQRSREVSPGDRITLRELGYEDRTIRGPGNDSTLYAFDVPFRALPETVRIDVEAARSSGASHLDGVGVIVNGLRVGLARFGDDGTVADGTVVVSADTLRPGRNLVRLDADFRERNPGCAYGDRPQSVEIAATTSITLSERREEVELDLDDLPYLFRDPLDAADLSVIVPRDPAHAELATAIDLAGLLGSEVHPAQVGFVEEVDQDALATRHLVVMGTPERQPLLARLGLEDDHGDQRRAGGGTIRLAASEVGTARVALALTGPDDDVVRDVAGSILDLERRGDMTGSWVRATFDGDEAVFTEVALPVRMAVVELSPPESAGPDGVEDLTGEPDVTVAAPAPVDDPQDQPPDTAADGFVVGEDEAGESGVDYTFEIAVLLVLGGIGLAAFAVISIVRWRRPAAA